MHRARDQFFAGAAFALNQHGAAGRSDHADGVLELLHATAGAHDVVERIASRGIALEGHVLALQRAAFDGIADGDADVVDESRAFADVIRSAAGLNGGHGCFNVINRSDEYDRRVRAKSGARAAELRCRWSAACGYR